MAYSTASLSLGCVARRHARPVAADEAPQRLGVLGVRRRHQRQQHRERDRHVGLRRIAGMDVPDRIGEALPAVLPRVAVEELLIFVDVARDDVEVEPLGRLRLAVHEQRQALGAGVAQPFVDGQAVALGLGDLLALLVEEQLVVEALRRRAAERAADFAGELHRIDQVLAGHLVVDAERDPAHRPVRLPLQLAAPAGDRRRHPLLGLRVFVGDGAAPWRRAPPPAPAARRRCADRSAGTANRSAPAPRAATAA